MPHNYIVMGTNPRDNAQVKKDVTDAAARHGGTGQNTIYFDDDNHRAYAFCGFASEDKARKEIKPMAKELGAQASGVVSTATELGLRAKPSGSRRRRPPRPPRGGAARRRRR